MYVHIVEFNCVRYLWRITFFSTECLPPEECPTLSTYVDVDIEISKEPGMMSVMNTSGCCPKLEKVCDQQLCPPSPVCPEYYTLYKNILTGACCPDYKCSEYIQQSYIHIVFLR